MIFQNLKVSLETGTSMLDLVKEINQVEGAFLGLEAESNTWLITINKLIKKVYLMFANFGKNGIIFVIYSHSFYVFYWLWFILITKQNHFYVL